MISSCGGGGDLASGGGSGVGGTGISFARGSVVEINGQSAPGGAQATGIYATVMVSGGGQSSGLNGSGFFALSGVQTGPFSLVFAVGDLGAATLPVGELAPGTTAVIPNIVINTVTGTVTSGPIQFITEAANNSGSAGSTSSGVSGSGSLDDVTGEVEGGTETIGGAVEGVSGDLNGLLEDTGVDTENVEGTVEDVLDPLIGGGSDA